MTREIPAHISAIIDRFAATPANLARVAQGKTLAELTRRSQLDSWTAHEIFAHMRAVDDIFTPRISMVLTRANPFLLDFNERCWAEVAKYADLDFSQSLALFTLRRAETVTILRQLSEEE